MMEKVFLFSISIRTVRKIKYHDENKLIHDKTKSCMYLFEALISDENIL